MWDKNDSSLRPLHHREIVWISTVGAPGSHKSSVHYEQGGWGGDICCADLPLRVKLLSLSPWALWPLSHWIIYISKVEPSEPSVTQIHRQEFPLPRTENRQRFYLTPGAKVWLAAFLPQDGRTLQQCWPSKSWARGDGWVWDAPTWVSSRSTHRTCACCATMREADVAAAPQIIAFV